MRAVRRVRSEMENLIPLLVGQTERQRPCFNVRKYSEDSFNVPSHVNYCPEILRVVLRLIAGVMEHISEPCFLERKVFATTHRERNRKDIGLSAFRVFGSIET